MVTGHSVSPILPFPLPLFIAALEGRLRPHTLWLRAGMAVVRYDMAHGYESYGNLTGCRTGNGEKLSTTQAEPPQPIKLADV